MKHETRLNSSTTYNLARIFGGAYRYRLISRGITIKYEFESIVVVAARTISETLTDIVDGINVGLERFDDQLSRTKK